MTFDVLLDENRLRCTKRNFERLNLTKFLSFNETKTKDRPSAI